MIIDCLQPSPEPTMTTPTATPTTDQVTLDRIGQIAVRVHDVGRATRFYRDTLGMRFLFEFPNLAFFDCGGVRLMLSTAEQPEHDHPGSVLYYKVSDINGSYETLKKAGV